MKGYKIFENDWTCKGFQFEIGKDYKFDGEIEICVRGFHFCTKLEDCFKYYPSVLWNKLAEVESLGKTKTHSEDSKVVTDHIKIIKAIDWSEIPDICKKGNDIRGGNDILGGNYILGGNDVIGCMKCEGISRSIFCLDRSGKLLAFNKKITEKRFEEIKKNILRLYDGWNPTFNNLQSLYLKNGSKWEKTPIPKAAKISKEEAWKDIPQDAIAYLSSLKEFNSKIFFEITGIKVAKKRK